MEATQKKERPILFSSEMVRAILEGRKTQTRRTKGLERFTHQPDRWQIAGNEFLFDGGFEYVPVPACPYGKVGDLLAVKETFYAYGKYRFTGKLTETGKKEVEFWDCTLDANGAYRYFADETLPKPENRFEFGWHKRPAIFMPLIAVRLKRPITNIKVERLQDISWGDCYAEGLTDEQVGIGSEKAAFALLWDEINAKREGCSWSDNPWLWCISFKKI